jgi:hypothetical protein
MRKLMLLFVASVSLIAMPAVIAHGKSTSHARMHASITHVGTTNHRGRRAVNRLAAEDDASQSQSTHRTERHPDEEELAVDESASKAKAN